MSTNKLGPDNVLRKVYDPATETLKVNAIATIEPGILEITLTAEDDSIAIGDGTNTLAVNPDGSINVVTSAIAARISKSVFSESLNVPSSVETTIVNFVAASGVNTYLTKLVASGQNIAEYAVKVNGVVIDKKRTYYTGGFNVDFDFGMNGLQLSSGDLVSITVKHSSSGVGNFNGRIQVDEV